MVALILVAIVIIGLAAGITWAGRGLTPTRPRPESRYRGKPASDVHNRLKALRKKR